MSADAVAVVTSALRLRLGRLRCDERGFTLIELLATMAVLGIILAVFATVISTAVTQSAHEQEFGIVQAESRASIEQFARELRQAYTGVDGSWPIEAISTTSITFLTPQSLRAAPFRLQRVQWQLNGTTLQRRFVTTSDTDGDPWVWPTAITSAAWATRARSVRNTSTAVFRGFEDDGITATTVPADVRVVQITLEASTVGQVNRKSTYTTRITPRMTPT
jgi:prepilin-type N-terminal cleavage/methylation domain-containing protein